MTEPLPNWLVPISTDDTPPPSQSTDLTHKQARRQLLETIYQNAFERVLVNLANGVPVKQALAQDCRDIDYQPFLSWIHKDDVRKSRYEDAQRLATELMTSEILEIADAVESLEDVQRSTLRINTRKFLMQSWNRKRYGETKQIEQNVNVDISKAMAEAQNRLARRVETIEGEYERE